MIVREIYCNALDEGLIEKNVTDSLIGAEGATTFYIQNVGEILETVNKWDVYFLEGKPLYSTENFAVYPASEHMRMYKNGVLIYENTKQKTVFSYDIKNADINELREYKGYAVIDIVYILKDLNKECAELFLATVSDKHFEDALDFTYGSHFSSSWKDAIGQGQIICKKDFDMFTNKGINIDPSGLVFVPQSLFNVLANQFPNISSVRRADKVDSFHETFDAEVELQLKACLIILETCGYEIAPELKFIYGHFGDQNVFARINIDEKLVMISVEVKRKSRFQLLAILIEENEHFLTGLNDETRGFQQHFIDLYTKTLLVKNEIEI